MATIYCLDIETKTLKWFEDVTDRGYTIEDHITVRNQPRWGGTELQELKTLSKGWDTIYSKNKIETEPHFHDDDEIRIIISGFGNFFVPVLNNLYIIEVAKGDYVRLNANVVHWFTSKKHLRAARFFEGSMEHKERMKDIPHEIYRLRDECVEGFKLAI